MTSERYWILVGVCLFAATAHGQDSVRRAHAVHVVRDPRIGEVDAWRFPEGLDRQELIGAMIERPKLCATDMTRTRLADPLVSYRGKIASAAYAQALINVVFTERNLPYGPMKDAVRELGSLRAPSVKPALEAIYRHADVLAERLATPCQQDRKGKWRCNSPWSAEDNALIAANYAHGIRKAVLDAAVTLGDADGKALLKQGLLSPVGAVRRHAERHIASLQSAR